MRKSWVVKSRPFLDQDTDQALASDIPCHAVGEPVDQLDKGEEPESDAQSHDAPKLKKLILYLTVMKRPKHILTCEMYPIVVILTSLSFGEEYE